MGPQAQRAQIGTCFTTTYREFRSGPQYPGRTLELLKVSRLFRCRESRKNLHTLHPYQHCSFYIRQVRNSLPPPSKFLGSVLKTTVSALLSEDQSWNSNCLNFKRSLPQFFADA